MKRQVGSENVDEAERIQCVTATTHKHKKQNPQNGCPDSLMSSNLIHERIIYKTNNYRTGTQIADLK